MPRCAYLSLRTRAAVGFKGQGRDDQARINAALRAFVEAHERAQEK